MPPEMSSALADLPSPGAADLKAGANRQIALVCLSLTFLLPIVLWGLPAGHTVHLSVDGRSTAVWSYQDTVAGVLASHHIVLRDGDLVTPSVDTRLWPGMQISVVRALPVTLTVGGINWGRIRVAAPTVGEALRRMGVSVGAADKVYPDAPTALRPAMRITVERREARTWVDRGTIAFTSQIVTDPALYKWQKVVRQAGRTGLRERTVRVVYANGRLVALSPSIWSVVQQPAPHILALGTRSTIASRGQFAGREFMYLEATAYYSGPNNYGGGVGPYTAIGLLAKRGVVAVDPSVIRLGTHLYVEGYGYAVAGDTGGAIQGMRIDLCYNTYDEAIQFGRRTVKVYILDKQ